MNVFKKIKNKLWIFWQIKKSIDKNGIKRIKDNKTGGIHRTGKFIIHLGLWRSKIFYEKKIYYFYLFFLNIYIANKIYSLETHL